MSEKTNGAGKPDLPDLAPNDPRVTAAIVKRIKEMPIGELHALLTHRSEGVIERQFPDPTPILPLELQTIKPQATPKRRSKPVRKPKPAQRARHAEQV